MSDPHQDPTFYYHWLAHKSCLHCGGHNLSRPRYPRGWHKCEDCNRTFDPMVPPAHMVGDNVIYQGYPSERGKEWQHPHLPYRPGMQGTVEARSQNPSNGMWQYQLRFRNIADKPQQGIDWDAAVDTGQLALPPPAEEDGQRHDHVNWFGGNQIEPLEPQSDTFPASWPFEAKVAMPIIPTKWDLLNRTREEHMGPTPQFHDRDGMAHRSPEYDAWLKTVGPEFEAQRGRREEWDRAARNAMATGRMTPEQVVGLGYKPDNHEQDGDWSAPKWGRWRPLPEQLYHVTTNLPAIVADGRLRSPFELDHERARGLGSFGRDDTISMTTSLEEAKNIERAMREGSDVASGRLPIERMVEMAERGEGADKPWLRTMFGDKHDWTQGNPRGLDDLLLGRQPFYSHLLPEGHPLKHLNSTMHTLPPEEWAQHGYQPYPDAYQLGTPERPVYSSGSVYRNLEPAEKAKGAFEWWRNPWAPMRGWAGGPSDPMFANSDADWFANLDPSHVGTVQLQPVPGGHGYPMGSLAEWRVPTGEAVNITGINGQPYQQRTSSAKLAHPLYQRWVFSPASGAVELSDNSGDPLDVKYHGDLARELNEPNLVHGYAYRISDGWRLLDWDSKPVTDPFVYATVMRKLRGSVAEDNERDSGTDDWDRQHLGLPG